MNCEIIFSTIYNNNVWNSIESVSGVGSEIKNTKTIIEEIPKLIKTYNIKKFIDCPCGDFNWMKYVISDNIVYEGYDIIDCVIIKNREKYNYIFGKMNIINDKIPECDLLFCRDLFVHFSYNDIYKTIKNIKSSNIKYLLTTTFPNHKNNDISTGSWRPLNLQDDPFNFCNPIEIINENCTENNGIYNDKSLALWNIKDINMSNI